MDLYEQAVLAYICGRPERFVSAQFTIRYDGFRGGSCPDFVVIDFADTTVYVIEVTAAADSKNVTGRIEEREKRWLQPLREHMTVLNPLFANWDYHVTIFVREEQFQKAQQRVANFRDVSVISLSSVVFSWNWDWQAQTGAPSNVLREANKPAKARAL